MVKYNKNFDKLIISKRTALIKKKEIYEQLKVIFAFSADIDDNLVQNLQEKTFKEDFYLLNLHKQFKIHRNKNVFVSEIEQYIEFLTGLCIF